MVQLTGEAGKDELFPKCAALAAQQVLHTLEMICLKFVSYQIKHKNKFHIFLTVHLRTILVGDQLDAQFLL
jgi:hypothetical protein